MVYDHIIGMLPTITKCSGHIEYKTINDISIVYIDYFNKTHQHTYAEGILMYTRWHYLDILLHTTLS